MTLPISPTSKFNYPWAKLFIAAGLACVVNLAAWANTALPTGIVKSLGLEGFKTIRLVGEDGKTLTVDEFNTRVAARQPFDMRKNPETSTATLTFNGNTPPAAINTIGLKVGSAMPALKRSLVNVKTGGILPPEDGSGYVFSLDVWVRQNLK